MSRRIGRSLLAAATGLLLLVCLALGDAQSDDIAFTATVDRHAISLSETVILTLTVRSGITSSLPEPVLGEMSAFAIEGQSSQSSSSVSFVNGKLTSEKTVTYLYRLRPQRTGELRIPPATLAMGGKKYRTDPITVTVSGTGEGEERGEAGKGIAPKEVARAPGEVFIRASANKERGFTEEGILLEYRLYSMVIIQDVSMIEFPGSEGFWWEEDPHFSEGNGGKEVVNGKVYTVYPLKRYIVYPLSPGTKTIEPMRLGCSVRVRTGDIFDAFSIFGREKNITVASEPVTLTVLPIPEKGRPAGFQGAVGNFGMRAELQKSDVETNEAVTLRVTVEGEGNFKTMGPPAVRFPEGLSAYPPDERVETIFGRDSLRGKKVFDYVLIPRAAGRYEIGDIVFPYFDPERGSYATSRAPSLELSVREGAFAVTSGGGRNSHTVLLGEDINYIKETPRDLPKRTSLASPAWTFLASNLISALLFFGFVVQRKRAEKILGNRALRRYRASGKELRKLLKEARKHLGHENHGFFAQRCEKAIVEFIGNRLDEETTGMTEKELSALLGTRQVEAGTMELFSRWYGLCQEARFSPGGQNADQARALLEKTERLAEKLEEALP